VRARDCHLVRAVTSLVNQGSVKFHQQLGSGDAQAGGVPVTAGYDGAGQDRVRFIKHLAA
jgi:hypothetical protein